jgi:uncharacterized protein (TIGR02147 family)
MNHEATQFLKQELARRMEKNPSYSMRAFAKALDLNVGVLSSLLSGKRPLTAKTAKALCEKLGVTPNERLEVLRAVAQDKMGEPLENGSVLAGRIELDQEVYRAVGDWYHWAILQLVRTRRYRESPTHSQPKWMAKKLRITETEAKLAVERLIKLGLLRLGKRGLLERTQERLTTANKSVTTGALRRWQKQIREKAIYSLENDPIESRSMSSITMAIDPAKIERARHLIDEFQEKLAEFLESGPKEKVYQLSVSLFPLQTQESQS